MFSRLLHQNFPAIPGFEGSIFLASPYMQLREKTEYFIRIIHCGRNQHWICLSGREGIVDCSIYDSMTRNIIDQDVGDQIARMIPFSLLDKPILRIRIHGTQQQKRTLCGYFACAYATSLCFGIEIDKIEFFEKHLTQHWLKCIKERKISMFPYKPKRMIDNEPNIILTYVRNNF